MSIETTGVELTPELLDLREHEKVIEQGLASFIDVGMALIAIKANKKYRHAGYATFEDYCEQRWGMSKTHANRLAVAAVTAESLMTPIGVIPQPQSEWQVRPLTLLPNDDDKRAAWAEAVEEADGEQPTAKQVEHAVTKRQPPSSRRNPVDILPIPSALVARDRTTVALRVATAKDMAARGATSKQIADTIGVTANGMTPWRRRHGVEVPADEVVGKSGGRIDPVRIVSTAVQAVDGIGRFFDVIDYTVLPADQIKGWLAVLTEAIGSLTTLSKRLKEQQSQP